MSQTTSQIIFCAECGAKITTNDLFCYYCGVGQRVDENYTESDIPKEEAIPKQQRVYPATNVQMIMDDITARINHTMDKVNYKIERAKERFRIRQEERMERWEEKKATWENNKGTTMYQPTSHQSIKKSTLKRVKKPTKPFVLLIEVCGIL